ncbi:unnamed protein product [Heligmosomoides polygyrus]|uniref:Cse1 domain-containing protein n=1 Tax=Heligmosomoides polygyrus TaxID=6339 RepID=A0A183F9Z2_HELPZ|nr:unnamed protein product [Heligmosomoides polygyrus]
MENEEELEQTPNICNTALNLLRFFGRYIRMTSLLPSIAEYSAPALTQLFEYFFYSICLFFGADGAESMEEPVKIRATLNDIADRLILNRSIEVYSKVCANSCMVLLVLTREWSQA